MHADLTALHKPLEYFLSSDAPVRCRAWQIYLLHEVHCQGCSPAALLDTSSSLKKAHPLCLMSTSWDEHVSSHLPLPLTVPLSHGPQGDTFDSSC